MTVGVDVPMVMSVGMGIERGHQMMLYYNITGVHRLDAPGPVSRPPDRHGDRGGQKREWQRHRRPEPDKPRRHEGDFPQ
jgi:hypothetical protein